MSAGLNLAFDESSSGVVSRGKVVAIFELSGSKHLLVPVELPFSPPLLETSRCLRDTQSRIAALTDDPLVCVYACRLQTDHFGKVPGRDAELPAEDFPELARLHVSQVCSHLPYIRRHEPALSSRVCRLAPLQVPTLRHAQQVHPGSVQAHPGEAPRHGDAIH